MNFPKIGMRNIKTSTSVFLCLLLFQILNRENSIQACIAAVICMQNTIVDSFKKGTERVKGTIIGGIGGAFVLFIVTTIGHEKLLIFIIPIGIIILIEICVTIDMKQSVVICCVVYLGILISKEHEGGYILYTFNRVLDTTVGIMITLVVNKYMKLPDKVKEVLGFSYNQKDQEDMSLASEQNNKKVQEVIEEKEFMDKEINHIENNEKDR